MEKPSAIDENKDTCWWTSLDDPAKVAVTAMVSDFMYIRNHMDNYGCGDEFQTALGRCNPDYEDGTDADACAEATRALRRCMEAKPVHFGACLRAMDRGLDEDERKKAMDGEPPQPWDDKTHTFRWWTGMMRNN